MEQYQERERAQAIQEDPPLHGKLYSLRFAYIHPATEYQSMKSQKW